MKSLSVGFDYSSLSAESRIVVQQRTQEIRDRIGTAAQTIIEIGQRLIEVKSRLPHGRFLPWLQAEFDWEERTAQQMMMVAERFKSANFADLAIAPSALYLLAAPSTTDEVRHGFIARATAGETIRHAEVKATIRKAAKVPSKAQIRSTVEMLRKALDDTLELGRILASPINNESTSSPPTSQSFNPPMGKALYGFSEDKLRIAIEPNDQDDRLFVSFFRGWEDFKPNHESPLTVTGTLRGVHRNCIHLAVMNAANEECVDVDALAWVEVECEPQTDNWFMFQGGKHGSAVAA